MPKKKERKHPRVDFRVLVEVEHESQLQKFHSRNLGDGGIFLVVEKKRPPLGAKVKLNFEVETLKKPISVEAEVVHEHEFSELDEKMNTITRYGIGLRFLDLPTKDKELIHEYVSGKGLRVA